VAGRLCVVLIAACAMLSGLAGSARGADGPPLVASEPDFPASLSRPIIYVHGFSLTNGDNCQKWNPMKDFFDNVYPYHTDINLTVEYYWGDTNCGYSINGHGSHSKHFPSGHVNGAHSTDTDIRHLGYHFAWFVWDKYSKDGQGVDIVAHSMGGLIVRYALAQVERGNPDFPPRLYVNDVVTLGTPHDGAIGGWLLGCVAITLGAKQCSEMGEGSDFIQWLNANANNPQGANGTDWTTIASEDDQRVSGPSGVGMGVHTHKVDYLETSNIQHDDYRSVTRQIEDADVTWRNDNTTWSNWYDAPWPVRWTQVALWLKSW